MSVRFPRLARPALQAPTTDAGAVAAFSRAGGLGVLAPGAGLPGSIAGLHAAGLPFALQLDHPPNGHLVALLARHPVPVLIAPGPAPLPGDVRLFLVRTEAEAHRTAPSGADGLLLWPHEGADPLPLVRHLVAARPGLLLGVTVPDDDGARACLAQGAGAVQLRPPCAAAVPPPAAPDGRGRELREAAALRENLRRRKAQSRRPIPGSER